MNENEFLIKLIVVITLAFGGVIFFLKRWVVKDTDSAVNRLQDSYEEVKKKKEELTQRLLEIENEYNKKKEEADKIAAEIKDKAQAEAYAIREDAFKKAKTESENIIDKAHKTIGKVREDIQKELEIKMIDFCTGLLERTFTGATRVELNQILVKEFIADLHHAAIDNIAVDCNTVEVVTIKALEAQERQELKKILLERIKREFIITEKIDEGILGGLVIRFGSLTLDGSLATRIKEASGLMKQKVEERV